MIANQPPTDLLQSALDHAYARGWHDGFVAGRQEESTRANERMVKTQDGLTDALIDLQVARSALWHVHTLLTSDGGDKVTHAQIVAHCEQALGWDRHNEAGE